MVGTVIGSGIFLVPRAMIQRVGTPEMVFFIFVFGGLLSLAGALTYAELAAMLPEAGGEYTYLKEAYGPLWGFLYSWTQMWVAKGGSIATLATGFFYYLANFFPVLDAVFYRVDLPLGPGGTPLELRYGQLFAVSLIMALAWLNYFGVKLGGEVQVAVTVVKVGLIAFIVVVGLGLGTAHAPVPVGTPAPGALTTAGFFAALVAALWAYDGWNNVSMVASEIRNPQRNLPIALVWGTVAVIVIYLAINAAYFHVLNAAEVGSSQRVAAEMMRKILGAHGADAVSVAAMISIFAALNGSHSFRVARALRGGTRRPLLRTHRACQRALSHARCIDSRAQRMVGTAGVFRTLRTTVHLRDLRQLDCLWNDDGGVWWFYAKRDPI